MRLPSCIFKRMYTSVNFGIWDDFHDAVHISAYCLHTLPESKNGRPHCLCRLQEENIVFQLTFQRQSVGFGACSAVFIGMLREHAPYHCTLYTVFDKITMVAPDWVAPASILGFLVCIHGAAMWVHTRTRACMHAYIHTYIHPYLQWHR